MSLTISLVVLSALSSANAQTVIRRRRSNTSRIIAGVIVGVLVLLMVILLIARRRRIQRRFGSNPPVATGGGLGGFGGGKFPFFGGKNYNAQQPNSGAPYNAPFGANQNQQYPGGYVSSPPQAHYMQGNGPNQSYNAPNGPPPSVPFGSKPAEHTHVGGNSYETPAPPPYQGQSQYQPPAGPPPQTHTPAQESGTGFIGGFRNK